MVNGDVPGIDWCRESVGGKVERGGWEEGRWDMIEVAYMCMFTKGGRD